MTKTRTSTVEPSPAEAFRDHLGEVRTAVEKRLAALWKPKRARATRLGDEVVAMVEVADDLTMRGGKRYRAGMLVAAFIGVPGAAEGAAMPPPALEGGAALELLQSYLLIQDDWMDGDVERRGGPSAHVALAKRLGGEARGAASAMLASDLVWNMAVEVLAGADVPPARRAEAIRVFCRMHEDVVFGQQLDTMNAACDVEIIHDLKTGSYTARGPLALGAALAGADAGTQRALERFAAPVGVAFQLRDDLIGTFGSAELAGRPRASDLRAGKRSAVIRAAEPLLDAKGKRALAAAFGKPDVSDATLDAAVKVLEASGVRDAVHARLEKLCAKAEKLAEALPLSPRSRTLLAGGAAALRLDPSHLGAPTRARPPSSPRGRRSA